jgi:hypothetical protein
MRGICDLEIDVALESMEEGEVVGNDTYIAARSSAVVDTTFEIDCRCGLDWLWVMESTDMVAGGIETLAVGGQRSV